MTETQEWIRFYEAQDLTYFPLYGISNRICRCDKGVACQNPGKHPVFKWKGQPSRAIRELDNIGISTNNLVVIDLDQNDPAQLDRFPHTFTTGTGHGFHLWYRADPTKPVKSMAGWKPKIDIRAIGGLIVAPPSRHTSGISYHHVQGEIILPVPRILLDELPEKGTRKYRPIHMVSHIAMETQDFMQPVVDKLVKEMEDCSDGRNQTLFRLACRGFELVASGVLGVDSIERLVEAALHTGLDKEEIMKTLDSAHKTV